MQKSVQSENDVHKKQQLQIINDTNPAPDDYHTWVRSTDDIGDIQNNHLGLTSANGISPFFYASQKSLADSNIAEQTVSVGFGKRDVGDRHTLACFNGSERVGQTRGRFIFKVGDFIDETPVEGFLGSEPTADFHQGEKIRNRFAALLGIELGYIKVELVKVGLNLLAVGYERRELVAVQAAPLEEGGGTLVNEVHGTRINGDVSRAERSDGSGGSIETHEMHIDIAVVTEGGRNRQAGGEGAAEAVNKGIDRLAVVLGKYSVNVATSKSQPPT